ncbi:NAD-dependent epimerase/dehydratase family protein [Shewanella sp. AC91-MNA-CIBAN-0169]|uniref:NAD-dependent epimerase/dehydratase family protein n=1 Tax=Shewanella sp. AC91-MNA-CIBAN-0169 TaxID=3140466 RepID=UPI0033276FEF
MDLTKLLITGASGFIGSNLSLELNCESTVLFSKRKSRNKCHKEHILEDISQFSSQLSNINSFHTVIHLAASAHNKSDSIDEHLRVNYTEALNFAEKAAEQGCNKFVYLSTVNVYGFGAVARPFKEDCIGRGVDDISDIRLKFECSLLELGRKVDMQVIILRCPLVYSLSAPANFGKFVKLTSTSRVLPFGSFNAKRSYLSLNNLLSAIQAVLSCKNNNSGVYNLSDDHDVSIKEMSNLIANYHNIKPVQVYLPHFCIKLFDLVLGGSKLSRLFLTPFQVDCQKFRKEFDWQPVQTPFEHFTPFEKSK